MIRRGIGLGSRLAAVAFAMALVLSLAGDRGRAATVPAIINGQDPLEVLSLKVRPNIVIVLDSSGSMTSTAPGTNTRSGDHPRSRMFQAKDVMRQVIAANEDKVSFQLGTYSQFSTTFGNQPVGENRFQYTVSELDTTAEIAVERALGDTSNPPGSCDKNDNSPRCDRGLQSWQIIDAQWNTLHFSEDASPDAECVALLPGPFPKFYQQGDDLAADLEAAMNSATCTGSSRANTYAVDYENDDGDFAFGRATGSRSWQIRWSRSPDNIRNALAETSTSDTGWCGTCTRRTDEPRTLLYRTNSGGNANDLRRPFRDGMDTRWRLDETISGTPVRFYNLATSRLWNGEVIRVDSSGEVCGMDFATPATMTSPPTLTVQLADSSCNPLADSAVFTFSGADFGRNTGQAGDNCRGFRSKSDLVPCDLQSPPAPTQISMIRPYIDLEFPFDATGQPVDLTTNGAAFGSPGYGVPDGVPDYVEVMDGGWAVQSMDIAPSAKAEGFTPIANSLIDIKGAADGTNSCITNAPPPSGQLDPLTEPPTIGTCAERGFSKLWNQGQAGTTNMAGPPPWQLDPIKDHTDPKEKTIVLFVTDGDDTCYQRRDDSDNRGDPNARRAAYWAERLFEPINATEPASSVQTYVIGFGNGASPKRLNWIAWGGSGLGQNQPGQPDIGENGNQWTDTDADIALARARCTTCEDAFIAPDAATLAAQLQGIIDQGASDGEFSAQQSITESIFEYVDLASKPLAVPPELFDPRDPVTRYQAIVPTRFISSFTLPGFRGQVKAWQNDGAGNPVLKWSAGDKLQQLVADGMSVDPSTRCVANAGTGASLGQCSLNQLHDSASDTTIATSSAAIKRRVYSTVRNGVYTFDAGSLEAYGRGAWTPPERVALWPPSPGVAPTNTDEGILDGALGLPLDSSATPATDFTALQNNYGACVGSNRPAGCTSASSTTRMKTARREARDMILAFMAGAAPAIDTNGAPKRAAGNAAPVSTGDIFYVARSWILGDSELATAAVVTQPLPAEPLATPWVPEYQLFRDGDGASRADSDGMLRQGFGLSNPDGDASSSGNDPRANLKPVMTVVYSPGNDMLHAFRAGPNLSPSASCDDDPVTGNPAHECGGQELWGFVPFDQLGALGLRFINEPQGRDNHVYMLARGVRFSDVFVADDSPPLNVTVGGVSHSVNGLWRRILYIPRGIGGKYVTALDVTGPGAHTAAALDTAGPIPLWSRGNPDTQDGTAAGPNNDTILDKLAYQEMGETWSMPSVVYRDKATNTNPLYNTLRRPSGIDYAIFMGSGYGAAGEGSTFFTLDALSGDVIAAVDVEAAAVANGLDDRTGLSYPNALVANAVGFNPAVFSLFETVHPAASAPTRVYIGDIHGRLWKFLTARPEVALPAAEFPDDQPIGTAVSLLGMPPAPDVPVPFVYAVSGNDRRVDGPFQMYGFEDTGTDTDITIGARPVTNGITTFEPMYWRHNREFDQGTPLANCGYTEEAVFRGTVQPATAFECSAVTAGTCSNPVGRVFFAGTRLNLPNTVFAPPTPLACGTGDYPCRSSFDSIIYALGAKTGLAAYDLNSSGDDAYRIFRDSRISAISMLADPDPGRGGSSFSPDEGMMKTVPKPPPPPGVPPTSTTGTANVVMERVPGQAPPSVHYGSTVCQ